MILRSKILLHWLRQHKINVILSRVTCYNHLLANDTYHRGHLGIDELMVCLVLPESHLPGGTSR